jgi:predicted ATP-binding protein involved in virulence
MHLLRVQVPKFRALENVDITFGKDFTPRIFPVGSLNGGGKSTLLQLIFTLLHCSSDPQKTPYLANLLETFQPLAELETITRLATLEIEDEGQIYKLQFFCCPDDYVSKQLNINSDNVLLFSEVQNQKEKFEHKIKNLQYEIKNLEELIKQTEHTQTLDPSEGLKQIKRFYRQRKSVLIYINATSHAIISKLASPEDVKNWCEKALIEFETLVTDTTTKLLECEQQLHQVSTQLETMNKYLNSQHLNFITSYHFNTPNKPLTLLCSINNLNKNDVFTILKKITTKIFLVAQPTQLFLFLSAKARLTLAHQNDSLVTYQQQLKRTKQLLPCFSTFEVIDVKAILNLFKEARDKDFQIAMETEQYGSYLQQLTKEFNKVLGNKTVKVEGKEFSSIKFQSLKNGERIDIGLEDLSHGELRRFSLYAWLKVQEVQDAVILIDEIEIGFHPDWQFQIVRDLQEWAPNSQFILATHSYDVCQALTRAHVKEIEPKLIKQVP